MTDILLIKYLEHDFVETIKCVKALKNARIISVDRKPRGIGSLAEAINRGFQEVKSDYFVVCTNVTFDSQTIDEFIQLKGYAAIQPTFASDHRHLREGSGVTGVPFTEFTFTLLSSHCFETLNGVDEDMPYVGFDIDYGLRCNQGYLFTNENRVNKIMPVACHHDYKVDHVYNRFMGRGKNAMREHVTRERAQYRMNAEPKTRAKLHQLYGTRDFPITLQTHLTSYPWKDRIVKPSL